MVSVASLGSARIISMHSTRIRAQVEGMPHNILSAVRVVTMLLRGIMVRQQGEQRGPPHPGAPMAAAPVAPAAPFSAPPPPYGAAPAWCVDLCVCACVWVWVGVSVCVCTRESVSACTHVCACASILLPLGTLSGVHMCLLVYYQL